MSVLWIMVLWRTLRNAKVIVFLTPLVFWFVSWGRTCKLVNTDLNTVKWVYWGSVTLGEIVWEECYVCIWGVHMCGPVHRYELVHVHKYSSTCEGQRWVSFITLNLFFEPGAHWFGWLTSPRDPSVSAALTLGIQTGMCQCSWLFMWVQGLGI